MSQDSQSAQELSLSYEFQVPFYDLDGIQMVWHGNYVKYMEDAREKFGAKFGFEYLHIFNSGYVAPVVDMHLKYRASARISDVLQMTIKYIPTRAAKMVFQYTITRPKDNALIIEAETTQLFVSRSGVFETANPDFYADWKKRWNIVPNKKH
jgi:acyl-CoA thioester hydrolase